MDDFPRKRRAVLVFARSLRMDLSRRQWPNRLAGLLRLPFQDGPFEDADVHLFTTAPAGSPRESSAVAWHRQRAGSFGVRLRAAVEELADLGYREVAIVGRDCPELDQADVAEAFAALGSRRLALGPDHKGGVYLIALRMADRRLLEGVRWRRDTDCRQLCQSVAPDQVHMLPVKLDLDGMGDLWLLGRRGAAWKAAVQRLLRLIGSRRPWRRPFLVHQSERVVRISWQLPPPVTVAP